MNLTGNTIFITGGGSGIGRGLAEELHKRGNKVIISGRRKSHLDSVAEANPGIEAIELDIADPDSIKAVAKRLIAEHPDLNVLINNAGIMEPDQAAGVIGRQAARVDRHDQSSGTHPLDLCPDGSAEEPSRCDHLQHFSPCLCANGGDGRLLRYKSCAPLLRVIATLSASRQRCSRS
jgi:NAD(P)-dependent dehydrogenase (short-subunit alcohol dehydrogenase family)